MSLASTLIEATELFRQLIAGGTPRAEALKSLEAVIREAWPKPHDRTEPWHFVCEDCSDTGWEHHVCTPQKPCGRPFRLPGQSAQDYTSRGRCTHGHTYVRPCWCVKGQAKRDALLGRRRQDEDFTEAGKAKPQPKGFSRFGR